MHNPPNPTSILNDPILDLVGHTPLIPLARLFENTKGIEVFAKLEYRNPSGSIKDRIAVHILRDAAERGVLKPGGTVIEATSGNTGASLALFCARLGYKLMLTTPSKTSEEKKNYMRALGADLVICPPALHGSPDHYQAQAERLARNMPDAFWVNQYDNPLNAEAHYLTTGPEIWAQMNGEIDWLVTGGATGGTVTGISRYLKQHNPEVRVLLPDPVGSVYYRYIKTGEIHAEDVRPYQVEGVGKDYLPGAMDMREIDEAMQYDDAAAFNMCRRCAAAEGILPGLSAGGNLAGVTWLMERLSGPARIVTLIQDLGVSYLSKLGAGGNH